MTVRSIRTRAGSAEKNWTNHKEPPGSFTWTPAADVPERIRVHGEDDLVRAVLHASQAGSRVRAIGSGGSRNGNYDTPGTQLDLRNYDALIDVAGNRVTVQAGMTISALNAILKAHGLAIATPGEWAGATVAGAFSTGTHGGSARHGCFATSVSSIRLVTNGGSVRVLDRDTDCFQHAGVSLGLLGIISELTIECVERFYLAFERRLVSYDGFLRNHDWYSPEHEFFAALWFPTAGQVMTYAADRCCAPRRSVRRPERFDLHTQVLTRLSRHVQSNPLLSDRLLYRAATGDSGQILSPIATSPRRVQWLRGLAPNWREVEFAVPLECAREALTGLDELLRAWPRALRLPIGIRATARDGFSLSPCFERDVLWISMFFAEDSRFTSTLSDFFLRFDARCNWGKNIGLRACDLRRNYPRWDSFRAVRANLDPENIFQNPFTQELGL